MKKILLTVSVLSFLSSGNIASLSLKEGFYVSFMPGISLGSMELRGRARQGYQILGLKNNVGWNLGGAVGYTWALKDKSFLAVRFLGGYNFSNISIGRDYDGDSLRYQPRAGFGLGVLLGRQIYEEVNAYIGLHFMRDLSRMVDIVYGVGYIDNFTVNALMPVVGITNKINEHFSWEVEVGYKVGLAVNGLSLYSQSRRENVTKYIQKPRIFLVSAGVTYHF